MLSRVLGSKFGAGYLKLLKKDQKKLLKDHEKQGYILVDTIVKMKKKFSCTLLFIYYLHFSPICFLVLRRIVFVQCKIYITSIFLHLFSLLKCNYVAWPSSNSLANAGQSPYIL